MNTARLTARVAWFGSYWTVSVGADMHICSNVRQLTAILTGKELPPATLPPPRPRTESVEEFLARGGQITKVSFPKIERPLAPAKPEPKILAPSRITLASLGLAPRPPSQQQGSATPPQDGGQYGGQDGGSNPEKEQSSI